MPVESWLTDPFEIQRHLTNAYFIIMALISLGAILLAWRTRFKWLALHLWLLAGTIGLIWESALFVAGSREYNFVALAELLYHALTEGGPGLIIATIFAHYVGIIDIERYRDPGPGGEDDDDDDGDGPPPPEETDAGVT